jgi:hypothetical protein
LDQTSARAVLALAGRRIDSPDTDPPRFPLENVPLVRRRIADLLADESAAVLVCSAACGADLLALEEAGRLGLRRRIVLPFARERFRVTSVTDRPGDWGAVFDRIVAEVAERGDLVVCEGAGDNDEAAYAAANRAIVREAQAIGQDMRRVVVTVWEGAARPQSDATGELRNLAVGAGFEERSVATV